MYDYYPDGLTPSVIDALIAELLDTAPQPTSAIDRERSQRREARRALTAVVRALPRPRAERDTGSEGEAA